MIAVSSDSDALPDDVVRGERARLSDALEIVEDVHEETDDCRRENATERAAAWLQSAIKGGGTRE